MLAIFPAALAVSACGASGEADEDFDYGIDAAAVTRDGSADAARDGGGSRDAGDSGDAARDGGALGDGALADGGPKDGAPSDAAVDAGPAVDAALPDPCANSTTCPTTASMGSVSGDTGNNFLQATGATSKWLLVRVTEDDSSVFSRPDLRVKFTLTHDPGTRFDLFVYKSGGNGGGDRNCSSVSATGTRTSTTNVAGASLGWSDTTGFGGRDDSANVMIEVRHVSGPCGSARPWYLAVDGNAN